MRQTFAGNYGNYRWANKPVMRKTGATCTVCGDDIVRDHRRADLDPTGFEYCLTCNAVRMPDGTVPPKTTYDPDEVPF